MHIDNTYLTNRTLGQTSGTPYATSGSEATQSSALPPPNSSHVPSSELLDLLDQVQQTPQVRPQALQRVAQRLASGYYLTRDAAEQTAEAIQLVQE